LEFRITDVEVDGSCTAEFAEPAENGAFILVSLSVSTASEWPSELEGINVDFIPSDWSIVGPDGLTESNLETFATYSCLTNGRCFQQVGSALARTSSARLPWTAPILQACSSSVHGGTAEDLAGSGSSARGHSEEDLHEVRQSCRLVEIMTLGA
jgi:hypothetical protein